MSRQAVRRSAYLKAWRKFVPVAGAILTLLVSVNTAKSNLYLDVQYASGGAAGSSTYTAIVDASHETFTLNVYALITDASPSTAVDTFTETASNFYIPSSTLQGDISFGSWSNNANTAASNSGSQFITPYGALGLGGSSQTVTTTTKWWIASAVTPLSGSAGSTFALSGSTIGVEYLLGTLTASFSAYALPSQSTSAPLFALPANRFGISKTQIWADSTGSHTVFGTASNVVNNTVSSGSNSMIFNQLGAGLNFVFSSTGSPPVTSTTYNLTALAASPLLHTSGTTTVTAMITNAGSGNDDSLNYGGLFLSVPGGTLGGAGLPKNGGPLALGASDSGSLVYTATAAGNFTFCPK